MKVSSIFLSLACLAMPSGLFGQQKDKASMDFAQVEYGFGTIRESDGVVSHDFSFTNKGSLPVIISRVISSCGCTTPEWPREPILPGKTGTIRVSFDPKDRPGSFVKSILVYSNADPEPAALVIRGVVIPVDKVNEVYRYSLGNLRLENIYAALGELYKGAAGSATIAVYNPSADSSLSIAFEKPPAHIKIKADPEILAPHQEGNLYISYDTEATDAWDYTTDRIILLINGKVLKNEPLTITASIREDFSKLTSGQLAAAPVASFDTTTYNFGTIGQDKPVEHSFLLTNTGKSVLLIRKITASCGCTAVQPEVSHLNPGSSTRIKTVFNPRGQEGDQKKAITVITNDPRHPRIYLWIEGRVEKSVAEK